MILVAVALLCLASTAFAAPTTSTSDNPKALLRHGPLQKREPICDDDGLPKPTAANCDHAIQTMPITWEVMVGLFGGTFSGMLIGSPFRLPRYFPYKDCMVEVDMKSRDVVEDHASWNDIALTAIHVFQACVEGPFYQQGGRDVVGSRSAIEVRVTWNFPELDWLASLNKPESEGVLDLHTPEPEEQLPQARIVGKPPLPPPSGRRKRPATS